MQLKNILDKRLMTVVAGVAVLAVLGTGVGYAANTISSSDIVNGTIQGIDVKNSSLTGVDIENGSIGFGDLSTAAQERLRGQQGPAGTNGTNGTDGATGPAGPTGATGDTGAAGADGADGTDGADGADATYAGVNWSIVDRNVIGAADSYLRAGPATAPYGVGSLGLHTASATDKAAFGNQVDFVGNPLSAITTVKYWVFTTTENNTAGQNTPNLASPAFEIDPTGAANTTGPNFSTLNYVPPTVITGSTWTQLDGSTAQQWYLTGAAGTASGCNQNTYCTLAQVKAFYPAATLFTAQLGKGRDYAFSGAVDGLQINNDVYDFEPFGVTKTTVSAGNR